MIKVVLLDVLEHEIIDKSLAVPNVVSVPHMQSVDFIKPEVLSVAWTQFTPSEFPYVKAVINRSHSRDHISPECSAAGVIVKHIGDYCSDEIASYVLQRIAESRVERTIPVVVGIGRIGAKVLEGCREAYSVAIPLHHNSTEQEVERAFRQATHISLNMQLTSESRMWLSKSKLEFCKDVVVVNTASPKLMDIKAILRSLDNGEVRHIYLDERDPAIRSNKKATCTAHVAYKSERGALRRDELTERAILEVLDELCTRTG